MIPIIYTSTKKALVDKVVVLKWTGILIIVFLTNITGVKMKCRNASLQLNYEHMTRHILRQAAEGRVFCKKKLKKHKKIIEESTYT